MSRIPFIVESRHVETEGGVALCAKIRTILFKNKIAPLPFASDLDEILDVLGGLKRSGVQPAILIANTFAAKEYLKQLDEQIGDIPAVWFRREMFIGKSGFMADIAPLLQGGATMELLKKMTLRETSIWLYGKLNADRIADQFSAALLRFLEDGEFRHIEHANDTHVEEDV